MALEQVATVTSWKAALTKAEELLQQGKLTAVAAIPEEEFAGGKYFAAFLAEHAPIMGGPAGSLASFVELSGLLHADTTNVRLMHGPLKAPMHPYASNDDWILAMVYS